MATRINTAPPRGTRDVLPDEVELRDAATQRILARYYAENHATLPDPLKAIQIGPVWRAERPQKGRYRQFTQCDIDVLGVVAPLVEIELILATTDALTRLGLSGLTVRINDRRVLEGTARHCGFPQAAHGAFFIAFDKLHRLGAGAGV